MKTIEITFFAVLLLCISNMAVGQNVGKKANPKVISAQKQETTTGGGQVGVNQGSSSLLFYSDLKGEKSSIYLGEDWPLGTIVLRNGKIIDNYNLRYNLLADQMQFIAAGDTLAFATPSEIETVMFDGQSFVYCTYLCDKSLKQGYFEILEPGNNKLLLKRMVTYHLNNGDNVDSKGEFLISSCYFIAKGNQPAEKIACNKKKALMVLDEHKSEIQAYVKKTGNKVKTEDELRKLVVYYNSLME